MSAAPAQSFLKRTLRRRAAARPKRPSPRTAWRLYALRMSHLRAMLARLRGGRRPPSGPLTTAEKATADELRTQTLLKDSERNTSKKTDTE
jgi:hypothetical protein